MLHAVEGLLNHMTMKFSALVSYEGSKRGPGASLRFAMPAAQRTLAGTFEAPGWLRITVDGGEPFFVYARRPPSRTTVEITLPSWRKLRARKGDTIEIEACAADAWRAVAGAARTGFDWLPHFADPSYFPVDGPDGCLEVWNRYEEPFVMRRVTEPTATYRMLGLYQAEGSKSADAPDFSLSNSNPALLNHAVELLGFWGLPRTRLSLEVLREPGTRPAQAYNLFAHLNVKVVAERVRTGAGGHAATLHVLKSQPLLCAVKSALAKVFAEAFPSKDAAREYALGWLDGDGSVAATGSESWSIGLRLAGYRDEQEVVLRALEHGFGWTIQKGAFGTPRSHTERVLSLLQAAELASASAFTTSMNRARLIHLLAGRLSRYKEKGRSHTTERDAHHAQALFDKHLAEEAARLACHPLAAVGFRTGSKGEPYP